MSTPIEYFYASDQKNHTHSYLEDPVLNILDPSENRCILDIGCGNGWLTNLLIDKGFNAYGIDSSEKGIRIANQKNPGRFFLHDAEKTDLPPEIQNITFDTILSTEVIEHLYSPSSFLQLCRQILEKNEKGELILTTPYHGYWKNLALAISGKMDGHFTVLWEGGHVKFFSRKTLSLALERSGFEVVKFQGCGRFPYFWKSMLIKAKLK